MTQLTKGPLAPVHSLQELFAIAYALEEEARTRYSELAKKMREHDALDTAAVFDRLAEEERGHRDQVTQWSRQWTGMVPKSSDVQWELPDTFDDEAAGELAGSRLATPYRALSMAVRNEERAFAFWTYVAAQADDAAIHQAAEAMAREELEHVALLRRERRGAYHAFRASVGKATPRLLSARAALAAAADLEAHFANQLRADAVMPASARARQHDLVAESQQMKEEASAFAKPQAGERAQAEVMGGPPDPIATAERLVECYLEAAEQAADEATLIQAQSLARRAITRLARLRESDKDVASIGPADNHDFTPARWPG